MNARMPSSALNTAQALEQVSQKWDNDIVGQLKDYIAIPAKSPMFAPDWEQQGLLDHRAAQRRQLGGGAEGARAEAGDCAHARAYPAAVF